MNDKNIDCVKLMRKIRDKHQSETEKDPELREKRLAAIRKKYGIKRKEKLQASH
jgi:hypothetical protein